MIGFYTVVKGLEDHAPIGYAKGDVAVCGAVAIDVDATAALLCGRLEPVVFGGEGLIEAVVRIVYTDHRSMVVDEGLDPDEFVVLCLQRLAEEGGEDIGEEVFLGVET